MATLVFGAVGTLIGGPLGGAIGSLLGRELDRQIIGVPTREGPRLKELAVSTSSYGTPIARLFGTTRASGTIIWATDMKERRDRRSGGKGQPGVAEYSYSVSLAVALSSRPIGAVRRIWADGNLLRGEAGDLKTGGSLRIHLGHGDQDADPLLAAALGGECPAHRGLAYAVFEDLALGDFGNRIPALSFEVVADGGGAGLAAALMETAPGSASPLPAAAPVEGFAHDGGSIAGALEAIGALVPLVATVAEDGRLAVRPEGSEAPYPLPAPIAWPDGEFGRRSGRSQARGVRAGPNALRYYDAARDYQPSVQRPRGRALPGGERALELPATLSAAGAATLVEGAALRARAQGERMRVRVASLDPALAPGRIVAVPGDGTWRVTGWEWLSGGVELDCERLPGPQTPAAIGADPGTPWQPADRLPAATRIAAFELPWDGMGSPDAARVHVAAGAVGPGRWPGAAPYVERGGALVDLGSMGGDRAVIGTLAAPLAGSPALIFEPAAFAEVLLSDPEAELADADGAALAMGANRLAVGSEIVQFMRAEPQGGGLWRISGLLRGRGASEIEARAGHAAGTQVVLIDSSLRLVDGALLDPASERIAAVGAGDSAPVFASVADPGRSRRPLAPVHPEAVLAPDGSLTLGWTRRARGAWGWVDGVETPLVEESEGYEVGAGLVTAPLRTWASAAPSLVLTAADRAALPPGTPLWVRQLGRHARSPALLLTVQP